MAKIPFSIEHREKIESGEYKVETRDGRTARIICWDRKDNNYPIIALFEEYGKECLISYTQNGQHVIGKSNVSDLFLVTPEPELSEFEKKLSDVFGYAISMSVSDPKKPTDEFVREYAPELLSLAREQLIKDGYVIEKKAFHDAVENISDKHLAEMSVQYSIHCKVKDGTRNAIMNWDTFQKVAQKFIDIGKEEALKDLPRWNKHDKLFSEPEYRLDFKITSLSEPYLEIKKGNDYYYIRCSELKKLPGFKEDEK